MATVGTNDNPPAGATAPKVKARTGTVTLAELQKELGSAKGLDEYVRLGEPFGITEMNVREFHPPLDLDSVEKAKE